MPLSPPAPREHLHTRRVECFGYARADGLWDVEGHIVDTKTYPFDNTARGRLEPGDPVHDMWVRLTVSDDMEIKAVEVTTEAGPFPICGDIAPAYRKLVGLRIVAGFTKEVRRRLGGVHGCTHITELLGPVATVAYQTMVRGKQAKARETQKDQDSGARAPHRHRIRHLNTCHALRADGPVVKQFHPDHYTGD